MLLKMMGIQRAWARCPEMAPKPRQIFVTQSPVLARKVKEYFEKLVPSEDITEETEDSDQEDGLIGQGYSKRWMSDIPERFSELLDKHFPLFIAYDKVWMPSFSK